VRSVEEPVDPAQEARRELFRATMMTGEVDQIRLRRRLRLIPRGPRCKACNAPFGMPGSIVSRAMGRRQWAKNPRFCDRCYSFLREYGLSGVEIPIAVLFADVRDSTTLAEQLGSAEFRSRINGFYRIASEALLTTDGLVDKFIGDGVMGLYIPGLTGTEYAAKSIEAARRILDRVGAAPEGDRLPVGVGVHAGIAFVGAVGDKAEVQDFTALGDAVNTTARLASVAGSGEALISVEAAAAAELPRDGLEQRHLEVKGRTQPVDVLVLRAGMPA
jgi:adenylate cyclase